MSGFRPQLSSSSLYELVDNVIIYLSSNNLIDKFKLQKAVFYFLWRYSQYKNIDFGLIAQKFDMVPYKYGPYSESVDGEIDTLVSRGFLDRKSESEFKATPKGVSELGKLDADVKFLVDDILNLLSKVDSKTLVFFIYYNPYIPNDVKSYFTSKSEIKEHFKSNKEKYIKVLKDAGIIEKDTAELILSYE